MPTTRLAPSPTGALHLGNARTFLLNWLLARQRGWRIVLRIEDLDGPRIKRDADQQAIDDLKWLGSTGTKGRSISPRAGKNTPQRSTSSSKPALPTHAFAAAAR